MKYRVRETKDVTTVQRLNDQIFPLDPMPKHTDSYYWLVWHGKTPVGFCSMYLLTNSGEPDCAFFSRAGVYHSHRGKGLGQRLIRVRLSLAKKLNLRAVVTYTIDNIPSVNNLIKAGFRLYEPSYKWAGSNALYWRTDLDRRNSRRPR